MRVELWVRGTRKSFKMDRNKLFNGGFKDDLTDQGLTLPPNEPDVVAAIRDHLIESDINADEVCTHDRLGFYKLNDKTVFLANEVIGDGTNTGQPLWTMLLRMLPLRRSLIGGLQIGIAG